jgi:branched-subunit amino acid aminotransferase/4-amino-4-deoxychorismate lyase
MTENTGNPSGLLCETLNRLDENLTDNRAIQNLDFDDILGETKGDIAPCNISNL